MTGPTRSTRDIDLVKARPSSSNVTGAWRAVDPVALGALVVCLAADVLV